MFANGKKILITWILIMIALFIGAAWAFGYNPELNKSNPIKGITGVLTALGGVKAFFWTAALLIVVGIVLTMANRIAKSDYKNRDGARVRDLTVFIAIVSLTAIVGFNTDASSALMSAINGAVPAIIVSVLLTAAVLGVKSKSNPDATKSGTNHSA